ncbi:MAG: hypothetical protein FWH20_07160 [Oscillospiraceae bacterium]|nr:hypothetical protein [Oscillospiraceae bacterium]
MIFSMAIYRAFLQVLNYMNMLFDILAGIQPITYKGQSMTIYDLFFIASPIAAIYWGTMLIGLALCIGFSIIAVSRRAADLNVQRTMYGTLGEIGRNMLTFLLTPVMIIALLQITSITMKKTNEMFYIANGAGTVDSAVFALTARNAAMEDETVIQKFANGTLKYDDESHIVNNLVQRKIHRWVGIVLSFLMMLVYGLCIFIMCFRLFVLAVLYITAPFFIAPMILDDGAIYKRWREALFGRLLSGYSLMIAVKIYSFIFIPMLMGDVIFVRDPVGDVAYKLILGAGGMYAMYKSSNLMTSIIAPNVNDEGMIVKLAVGITIGKAFSALNNKFKS